MKYDDNNICGELMLNKLMAIDSSERMKRYTVNWNWISKQTIRSKWQSKMKYYTKSSPINILIFIDTVKIFLFDCWSECMRFGSIALVCGLFSHFFITKDRHLMLEACVIISKRKKMARKKYQNIDLYRWLHNRIYWSPPSVVFLRMAKL